MKKRVKLFTTIASLCLAVALMAFGVYAATQAKFSVSSTVAFESKTVFIDISGTVAGMANEGDTKLVKSFSYAHDKSDTDKIDKTWQIGAMTFDEDHKTITYTIEFTNQSEFAINITPHTALQDTDDFGYVETGRDTLNNIASTTKVTYTLKVTLKHFEKSISATPVLLSFTAEKASV